MNSDLKTIKYHGQARETNVAKLRDANIILTTYHTLAAEFSRKDNPLNEIEWYRLVLDEGRNPPHDIGNMLLYLTWASAYHTAAVDEALQNRVSTESQISLVPYRNANPGKI